jgi:hypothetical protein
VSRGAAGILRRTGNEEQQRQHKGGNLERAEPVLLIGDPGTGQEPCWHCPGHRRLPSTPARPFHDRRGAVRPVRRSAAGITSLLIVDSQSVKIPIPQGRRAMTRARRISGIKRHIAVDTWPAPCYRRDYGGGDRPQRRVRGDGPMRLQPRAGQKRVGRWRLPENLLPTRWNNGWVQPCRWFNAMNFTPSSCCPCAETSNVPSLGWRSAEDSGRTANANSTLACNSAFLVLL